MPPLRPGPRRRHRPRRFARAAEAHTRPEPSEPATPSAEGARPLLDLFPPPPVRDRGRVRPPGVPEPHSERPVEVPPPAIAGAPPPRMVRSRLALPVDPAPQLPAAPLTYEPFYGLSENPFSLSTDPKFVYHSTSHDRALQELSRCARPRRPHHAADRGAGNRQDDGVPIARSISSDAAP